MTRFFEDLTVGETFELGTYDVTEAEMLAFAEQYDPQWFHTDPERAREESIFGGLIASGWQTTAITMRLLVDGFLDETAMLGAKGVDDLRWRRPVRPGDCLSATVEVAETTVEPPDRGEVRLRITTSNGDGETVCTMVGIALVERRPDE